MIGDAPVQVSSAFAAAISSGDVDAALACWTDDAVMIAPDGTETRGHTALRERFAALVGLGAHLDIAVADVAIDEDGARATTTMRLAIGTSVMTTRARVTYTDVGTALLIQRDEIMSVTS